MTTVRRAAAIAICIAIAAACGAGRPASAGAAAQQVAPPLAGLSGQSMILFPVHYLRTGDTIGWGSQVTDNRRFLATFDSTLEALLKARGISSSWRFPPDLARSAQRNAGYLANPYGLGAQSLRPPARANDNQLPDPLASQMRAWVSINDTRLAILPVEIRFDGQRTRGVAMLRLALVDARLAKLAWMADVRSDSMSGPDEAMKSLAMKVANLIIAP